MKQIISTNMKKYESKNILKRVMLCFFKHKIYNIIKLLPYKEKICDAGCGEGFIVKYLEKKFEKTEFYGFDRSEEAIKIAEKNTNRAKYSVDNVYNCKYSDNEFDVVMLLEVLEHLENPQKALKEIIRITKRVLIISVPQEPFFCLGNFFSGKYMRSLGNPPEHINHWTYLGFRKYLNNLFSKNNVKFKLFNLLVWTIVLIEKNEKTS